MTFDEILAQIIDLLKRQGRVSYPALKVRFSLDDEYLEALKAELLYVHPVRDDDGRGLLWTGDTASVQEVVSQPGHPTPQPAAQEQPSPEVTSRSTVPPPDAGSCTPSLRIIRSAPKLAKKPPIHPSCP